MDKDNREGAKYSNKTKPCRLRIKTIYLFVGVKTVAL